MVKQPKHKHRLTADDRKLIAIVMDVAVNQFRASANVAPTERHAQDLLRKSREIEALAAILAGADSIVLEMTKP